MSDALIDALDEVLEPVDAGTRKKDVANAVKAIGKAYKAARNDQERAAVQVKANEWIGRQGTFATNNPSGLMDNEMLDVEVAAGVYSGVDGLMDTMFMREMGLESEVPEFTVNAADSAKKEALMEGNPFFDGSLREKFQAFIRQHDGSLVQTLAHEEAAQLNHEMHLAHTQRIIEQNKPYRTPETDLAELARLQALNPDGVKTVAQLDKERGWKPPNQRDNRRVHGY